LRGDYRLIRIEGNADMPAFFGGDSTRYGHRVYAGIFAAF